MSAVAMSLSSMGRPGQAGEPGWSRRDPMQDEHDVLNCNTLNGLLPCRPVSMIPRPI